MKLLFQLFVCFLFAIHIISGEDSSDFSIDDDTEEGCSECGQPKSRDAPTEPKEKTIEEVAREQQELRDNLPHFDFPDTALHSLKEISIDQLPPRSMGCGVSKIVGATFWMGSEDDDNYPADGESPFKRVRLTNTYWMDRCEVTNAQFLQFWNATELVTEAERYGWSFVFELFVSKDVNEQIHSAVQAAPWWIPVPGSDFRHPEGPDSNINSRLNHPVLHVGWTDAAAYCKWKGGRLPTEAEWEYAARGGLERATWPWGNEMHPNLTVDGTYSMNTFTGEPYVKDDGSDGYPGSAPVATYWPNGYGLYDVVGNAWEWVSDYWTPRPTVPPEGKRVKNPKGPKHGRDRTMKGGSFMCHPETCRRYRISGRSHAEPDSSTGNLGFRCAYDTVETDSGAKSEL